MADLPQVKPTEHYRNLDDVAGINPSLEDSLDPVTVVIQEDADKPVENIGVERSDGALIIRLDARRVVALPRNTTRTLPSTLMSASYPVYATNCSTG